MITFKLENEKQVIVLLDGNEVGRIFAPGDGGSNKDSSPGSKNSIQVCGFEEAFDLWGCGVYGEELKPAEEWFLIAPSAAIYSMTLEQRKEWFGNPLYEDYKEADGKFYKKKITSQFRMKKDIQLLFTPFTNLDRTKRIDNFSSHNVNGNCLACHSKPCHCESKDSLSHNPFIVKRGFELFDSEQFQESLRNLELK